MIGWQVRDRLKLEPIVSRVISRHGERLPKCFQLMAADNLECDFWRNIPCTVWLP